MITLARDLTEYIGSIFQRSQNDSRADLAARKIREWPVDQYNRAGHKLFRCSHASSSSGRSQKVASTGSLRSAEARASETVSSASFPSPTSGKIVMSTLFPLRSKGSSRISWPARSIVALSVTSFMCGAFSVCRSPRQVTMLVRRRIQTGSERAIHHPLNSPRSANDV